MESVGYLDYKPDERQTMSAMPERVRFRRQGLQDNTAPLKDWLSLHKDNPYPNKSEKMILAQASNLSLTQVTNWFANTRRRIKHTVNDRDTSWRGKMFPDYTPAKQDFHYNDGSDDYFPPLQHEGAFCKNGSVQTETRPDEDCHKRLLGLAPRLPLPLPVPTLPSITDFSYPIQPHSYPIQPQTVLPQSEDTNQSDRPSPKWSDMLSADSSHPGKFKQCILQRYLNDAYEHALTMRLPVDESSTVSRPKTSPGSVASNDYETSTTSSTKSSPRCSPVRDSHWEESDGYEELSRQWPYIEDRADEDLYWKEISAALALTTMARNRRK